MSNYKSFFYKSLGLHEDQLPTEGIDVQPHDPQELQIGMQQEMKNVNDPAMARKIALDHLEEDSNYYSRLQEEMGDDENEPSETPNNSKLHNLLAPHVRSHPSVMAVSVRGTKTGLLPGGGIVDDPEKARLGGWELVKNLKANSQGAYSDTPASPEIKADGGHYTPDNKEITKGKAPETNVKEDKEIMHPMQVQQIGNKPFKDDGTTHDGKTSPPAATAGVEGGSAPHADGPSNTSKSAGGDKVEPKNDDDSGSEDKKEGPWGIPMGGEDDAGDSEEEVNDLDENRKLTKEGLSRTSPMGHVGRCPKCGGNDTSNAELEQDGDLIKWTCKCGNQYRTDIDLNPQQEAPTEAPESETALSKECGTCGCGNPNDDHMKQRFQQLANIRSNDKTPAIGETEGDEAKKKEDLKIKLKITQPQNEAGMTSESGYEQKVQQLRELVGRLKAGGKVSPILTKAEGLLQNIEKRNTLPGV